MSGSMNWQAPGEAGTFRTNQQPQILGCTIPTGFYGVGRYALTCIAGLLLAFFERATVIGFSPRAATSKCHACRLEVGGAAE